jgi:hypothetical protein
VPGCDARVARKRMRGADFVALFPYTQDAYFNLLGLKIIVVYIIALFRLLDL